MRRRKGKQKMPDNQTLEGATYALFTVRLSAAPEEAISIDWSTEDATGKAGRDYQAAAGTLVFEQGETEKSLQVLVYGRPEDDTDDIPDRYFNLRISPAPGIILGAALSSECHITVVRDDDGATYSALTIPRGPKGRKGDPGLSAYELAQLAEGFSGTLAEWLTAIRGRAVDLSADDTAIYWRYTDEADDGAWRALVPLAELKGAAGPGIEMQLGDGAIQFRREGDDEWADLLSLADLKGERGENATLTNRGSFVAGTAYQPGDYVIAAASDGNGDALFFLIDQVDYAAETAPGDDPAHWAELLPPEGPPGVAGEPGKAGREIELQMGADAIQWRYAGDAEWQDLVALADLKGEQGDEGAPGADGAPGNDGAAGADGLEVELQNSGTHIQWRYVGEPAWSDLAALADLSGADGRAVELQMGVDAIQWRHTGDADWQDLAALADLKGEKGENATLSNQGAWVSGTEYQPGAYVAATSSADPQAVSLFFLIDQSAYTATEDPKDDPGHWIELQPPEGAPGADGRKIEIQAGSEAIEWRYSGDADWNALIALADIKGDQGDPGTEGSPGADGARWLTGDGAPSDTDGADGDMYLDASAENGGDVYRKDGGAWAFQVNIKGADGADGSGGGGDSAVVKAVLPNDVGQTAEALSTLFTFDVVSGNAYRLHVTLAYRANVPGSGIAFGLGGTAGYRTISALARTRIADGSLAVAEAHEKNTRVVFETVFSDVSGNLMLVEALLVPTGSGTCTFQFAPGVAYDYVAALRGSFAVMESVGAVGA